MTRPSSVDPADPTGTGGGANGSARALEVRDARFAAQKPRAGNEVHAAGADAPLSVSVINSGDVADRLLSVSSPVASGDRIYGDAQILDGFTLVPGYQDVQPARVSGDTLPPRAGDPTS